MKANETHKSKYFNIQHINVYCVGYLKTKEHKSSSNKSKFLFLNIFYSKDPLGGYLTLLFVWNLIC